GAREVHLRIASPPITHSDFYGIDTPDQSKLLAHRFDLEGMRSYIGVDSLAFLTVDGLYKALGYDARNDEQPQLTDHCFTGDYPTKLTDRDGDRSGGQLSLLAEIA
ncbi:MAG: amidophosphoribosyltransferase, partial [Pseudomonadota bacterium]